MSKKGFISILATIPLLVLSCAKEVSPELPEVENIVSVIDPWTGRDISEYDKTLSLPAPVTIKAGHETTKSHLEMDGDSYVRVVWDDADQFKMLGRHENAGSEDPNATNWYGSTFTAPEGGDRVTFNPNYWVPPSPNYHCFYVPLSQKGIYHTSEESFGFGITIPTIQVATDGGLQKGLNYSYARLASFQEDAHFQNMLALVRFKMSGAVVSTVTTVTLQGVSPLAGDCVLVPAQDGTPELTFSKSFVGDVASNTVRLSGNFVPDTWYYIAVAPGTQAALTLSFTDGDKITTKIATRTATFTRGRIMSLGTINLGDELDGEDPNKPIQYKTATRPGIRPVTFAVIPDGFTQAEMSSYEMLAKAAVNKIFSVEPFKSYEEYFNVYILKVPSNESGVRISNGTTEEQNRDCYFQSSWASDGYSDMRANDNTVFNYVAGNCPDILDGTHDITEVPVLMIINDTRYGGINWTYSNGPAYCMAPYCYGGASLAWNYPGIEAEDDISTTGTVTTPPERYAEISSTSSPSNTGNWLNIVVHEFAGHCFSRLKDEYWYSNAEKSAATYMDTYRWPVPFGANVSVSYDNPGFDSVSGQEGWQHLLDNQSSLVGLNTNYGRIGVFQGGDVSIHNRWRSERVSCMIDNRCYFSAFQRELIVKRIQSLAGETFDFDAFLAKDVTLDPNRDIVTGAVMGPTDPVTPRIMPPLPPPGLVVVE